MMVYMVMEELDWRGEKEHFTEARADVPSTLTKSIQRANFFNVLSHHHDYSYCPPVEHDSTMKPTWSLERSQYDVTGG